MKFPSYPDTVLTASDLETFALGLTSEMPIPGVEGCGFGSRIVQQTLLQAAVDQKSSRAVTVPLVERTLATASSLNFTPSHLTTSNPSLTNFSSGAAK
ncbi:hypothetical protein [Haloplanus salinus]|jgi:hypothetical protein|uniref:hypothetical protein n=1 Tax=Haloplanus salinus TaxID=1126245 RepID=UPI001C6A018D|nr:hypothetical protein [Haloplanus salinus]